MSSKQVLICDDDQWTRQRWQRSLRDYFEQAEMEFKVYMLEPAGISKALDALEARRAQARSTGIADKFPIDEAKKVDEADVFIIDFDLFQLEDPGYITGENLAYLSRCYSGCGLIIAVNQFEEGRNVFDLTLSGHLETFADLHLGDPQLFNAGLWAEPWEGFRPWAWPLLPLALEKFKQRVRDLRDHLDQSIFEFLELTDLEKSLPRSALEFVARTDEPCEVSFTKFVTESGNGLKRKDMPFSRESIAQIAAARLAKWLEYVLLPGQDILVDAPHLISRYPSLVEGKSKDINAWNKTASFGTFEEVGLDHATIEDFRFKRDEWLSRPAWFWKGVSNCSDVAEVADPWSTDRPGFVFCEDISCFAPEEQARGFDTGLLSPNARRFIKGVDEVEYIPRARFSL